MSDARAAVAGRLAAVRDRIAQHRPAALAGAVAAAFAVAYLIAPLTGLDLSAQIARADFARDHPVTPVDLRWYGGTLPFGYSLWTPLAMAWVGVRLTAAICCVVAAVQTAVLFERTGAKRPAIGGVLAAAAQVVNLLVGRVTFGVGMVCGLGALLALTSSVRVLRLAPAQRAAVLAFLAGAASPVAALYLCLCGAALALAGRPRHGVGLVVASAVPVVVISGVFGDGGNQPYSLRDLRDALLATVVVLLVVPMRRSALWIGAVLALAMVVLAYAVETPVGSNASRLTQLFAVPVVAAYVTWRPWLTAVAVVAAGFPQQVVVAQWFTFGPSASASYYAPLVAEIRSRDPLVGRVEVPDTKAHWEAAFLARSVPLARGWLRQVDYGLNEDVFYSDPPTEAEYREWLDANAVQYVAVPDAALSLPGTNELDTIDAGPDYLRQVWANDHWRLFEVVEPVAIVEPPGELVAMDSATITVEAADAGTIDINVRWFRWLSLDGPGGCIEESPDGRVQLTVHTTGRYELTSSFAPAGHC